MPEYKPTRESSFDQNIIFSEMSNVHPLAPEPELNPNIQSSSKNTSPDYDASKSSTKRVKLQPAVTLELIGGMSTEYSTPSTKTSIVPTSVLLVMA